jgi:hypothetical protein
MDEFELFFSGTPSEFGVMAKEFDKDFVIGGARYPTPSSSPFADGQLRPDANPVNAILYQSKGDGAGNFQSAERLRITAQKVPGGKSKLRIRINTGSIEGFDEYPEAFEKWERLKAEMERQGWIEFIQELQTEPVVNWTSDEVIFEVVKKISASGLLNLLVTYNRNKALEDYKYPLLSVKVEQGGDETIEFNLTGYLRGQPDVIFGYIEYVPQGEDAVAPQ